VLAAASYRAETAAEGAVAIRKKQRAIAAPDVLGKFNDAWIAQLGEIGRLPVNADLQRFGDSVREVVRIYARDACRPTATELRAEIAALLRAAERREYESVATLIENLSPEIRRSFEARAERPGFETITAASERRFRQVG
jgi:hypothetical protein